MKRIYLAVLLLLLLAACFKLTVARNYYILDYISVLDKPELSLAKPLPFAVVVRDAQLPRTYDRTQMVIRHSAHRIDYSSNDLWAVRLSDAVPDLINDQINSYHLFKNCQREYLDNRPDYEIVVHLNRIELFQSPGYRAVNLNMDYYLQASDSRDYLLKYTLTKEEEVPEGQDMDIFARKASELIKEGTDQFLIQAVNTLKNQPAPANTPRTVQP